ncbi:hypothetical protein [Paenibacillus sp. NPDC055715]
MQNHVIEVKKDLRDEDILKFVHAILIMRAIKPPVTIELIMLTKKKLLEVSSLIMGQ